MSKARLILYTRKECCLCEGLERRIMSIPLESLTPSLELCVVDIDAKETPKATRERFNWEVPVLLVVLDGSDEKIQLPRVSPRIKGEALFRWFQKEISKVLNVF